jgi:hypothetical protein
MLILAMPSTAMDSLVGYRLGVSLSGVPRTGFLEHRLPGGETLIEACSADRQVFLTLADDPWSEGRIAYISIERVDDGRCAQGVNPSFVPARTKEGLQIGDAASRVTTIYGAPAATQNANDRVVLRYPQGLMLGRRVFLAITVSHGVVVRIALGLEARAS